MKAPDAFRTISEVAQDLDLPQHVLRFWETRFAQIKPMKRGGGRRYYRPEDVDLLRGIRLLLYAEGFTIRGVQRLLKENGVGFVVGVGQTGSVQASKSATLPVDDEEKHDDAPAPREAHPAAREPWAEIGQRADIAAADLAATPFAAVTGPESGRPAAARPPLGSRPISQEGRRRIETALADLLEAKRLLDTVR